MHNVNKGGSDLQNDLQSTKASKLVMLTMEVGCDWETEYSHSFTPAASQFSAKPLSSFSSQQKLWHNIQTGQWTQQQRAISNNFIHLISIMQSITYHFVLFKKKCI